MLLAQAILGFCQFQGRFEKKIVLYIYKLPSACPIVAVKEEKQGDDDPIDAVEQAEEGPSMGSQDKVVEQVVRAGSGSVDATGLRQQIKTVSIFPSTARWKKASS